MVPFSNSTHRIWTSAGSKLYEVAKARIQLLFLSGQYPCVRFARHWCSDNSGGLCTNQDCLENGCIESIEHILLTCPAYISTGSSMIDLISSVKNPVSMSLAKAFIQSNSKSTILQFLLDCTSIPEVVSAVQQLGEAIYSDLFYLTRTWCYCIHKERMKRLGKWNYR